MVPPTIACAGVCRMTLYRCIESSIVGGKVVRKGDFIETSAEQLGEMAAHFVVATVQQTAEADGGAAHIDDENEPDDTGLVKPVRRSVRQKGAD